MHTDDKRGGFFGEFTTYGRFYVICTKLDERNEAEITPILHDFIATCGCASWELGEE
jgi:hypothetical protein